MTDKIPVSVIVVTRNEEKRIVRCLRALSDFDDVLVFDSYSQDQTEKLVRNEGVRFDSFRWNGEYPKKRQFCLDFVTLKYDWVFFVDADEIVTSSLVAEIRRLFVPVPPDCAGYFITGRYRIEGKVLRFGLPNNKIALFHRKRMAFPVVDDLDIAGMGEIEGHYQPILIDKERRIGQLSSYLIHDAFDDEWAWSFRHEKYARWEVGMNRKGAWPQDPVPWREILKKRLRMLKIRPQLIFSISFIVKFGFLDGVRGKKLAVSKYKYYDLVSRMKE